MINLNDPILGDAGTLIRNQMQSEGFVSGSNGWRIARNGDAEFNDVTVRGDLVTGTPPGRRIEILKTPGNTIDFYSGDADEVENGFIRVDAVGNSGFVEAFAPDMDAATFLPAFMRVRNYDDGSSDAALGGDIVYITANDGTLQTGVDSGDATGAVYWFRAGSSWTAVTFAGNWAVSGGMNVEYFKDSSGTVRLRGRATEAVAASTTIFTFPTGYRPTQAMSWALKSNNDAGTISWVQVGTNGACSILGNVAQARVQIILDAISFPTL